VSHSLALELALTLFKTARIVQPKINAFKRALHRTYLRFIKKLYKNHANKKVLFFFKNNIVHRETGFPSPYLIR
jgi:hypothetical protein